MEPSPVTGSLDAQTVRDALPPRQTGAVPTILPAGQMRTQAAHEALDRLVASVEALTGSLERAEFNNVALHGVIRVETRDRKAAEARVVALTAERDEALGLLDNERLYTAEYRGYAQIVGKNLAAVESALQVAEQEIAALWCEPGCWRGGADDLTSGGTAAKVPPVQAAQDSPREDASAPEGTAT